MEKMVLMNTPDLNNLAATQSPKSSRTSLQQSNNQQQSLSYDREQQKNFTSSQQVHVNHHSCQQSKSDLKKRKKNKNKDTVGPWKLGKTLGKGSSGRVRLAKHMETGQLAAIKIVPKKRHKRQVSTDTSTITSHDQKTSQKPIHLPEFEETPIPYGIEREIIIMKLVTHSNIMALYEVWENKNELYLVLEYVDGGELFDYLVSMGKLPEAKAVYYFKQIIEGVSYLHKFNICHRDLKPENLLLDKKNQKIKIADFGMAALELSDKLLQTSCGSPHYASPEIVSGKKYHGSPSDVWSCGIILFALLAGHLPFNDNNVKKLLLKVQAGKFTLPEYLSYEAKDLISRMLVVDASKRISIEEILYHPLLIKYTKSTKNKSSTNIFKILQSKQESSKAPHTKNMKLPITPEIVKLRSRDDLDPNILESLQILWHGVSKETVIHNLLSPTVTDENIFYSLLHQYQVNQHNLNQKQQRDSLVKIEQEALKARSSFENPTFTTDLLPALTTNTEEYDDIYRDDETGKESSSNAQDELLAPKLKPKSQFSSRQSSMVHMDSYIKVGKSPSMTRTTSGVKSFVVSKSVSSKPGLGISGNHSKSPRKTRGSAKLMLSRSSSTKSTHTLYFDAVKLKTPSNDIPLSPKRFFQSPQSKNMSPSNMFKSQSRKSLYSLNSISKKSINLKNYLINDNYIENEENPLPEYKNEFAILCQQILFQDENLTQEALAEIDDTAESNETLKDHETSVNVGKSSDDSQDVNKTVLSRNHHSLDYNESFGNNEKALPADNFFRRLSLDPKLKKATTYDLAHLLKKDDPKEQSKSAFTSAARNGHSISNSERNSSVYVRPLEKLSEIQHETKLVQKTTKAHPPSRNSSKKTRRQSGMISLPSGFLKTTTTFQDLSTYIRSIDMENENAFGVQDIKEVENADVPAANEEFGESTWNQTTIPSRIETAKFVTGKKPNDLALSKPASFIVPGANENVFEDLESGDSSFFSSSNIYEKSGETSDSDFDVKTHKTGIDDIEISSSFGDERGDCFNGDVSTQGKHRKIVSIGSFDDNNMNSRMIDSAGTVDVRGSLYVNKPGAQLLDHLPKFKPSLSGASDNFAIDRNSKFADFDNDINESVLNFKLLEEIEKRKTLAKPTQIQRETSAEIIAKFELTPDKNAKQQSQDMSSGGEPYRDETPGFSDSRNGYSFVEPSTSVSERRNLFLRFKNSESSLDMALMFKTLDNDLHTHDAHPEPSRFPIVRSSLSPPENATNTELMNGPSFNSTIEEMQKDISDSNGKPNNGTSAVNHEQDEVSFSDGDDSNDDNFTNADTSQRLMKLSVNDIATLHNKFQNEENADVPQDSGSLQEEVASGDIVADLSNTTKKKQKRVTMLFDNDEDKKFSLKLPDNGDGKPIRKKVSIKSFRLKNRSEPNTPLTPMLESEPKPLDNNQEPVQTVHSKKEPVLEAKYEAKKSNLFSTNTTPRLIIDKRNVSNVSSTSATKRENWFSKMINRLGRRISSTSSGPAPSENTVEEKQQHYTSLSFDKLDELSKLHLKTNSIKYHRIAQNTSNRRVIYSCMSHSNAQAPYKFNLEINDNRIIISKKFSVGPNYLEENEQFQDFNKNISKMIASFSAI